MPMLTTFERAHKLAAVLGLKESRTEAGQRAWVCPFADNDTLTADGFFDERNCLLPWLLKELPKKFRYGYELGTLNRDNDTIRQATVWKLGKRDGSAMCNENPLIALVDALLSVPL